MNRVGWIMSALFAAFMIGASVAPKLLGMPIAEQTLAQLGWPHGYAILIGIIELTCTVLYLLPATPSSHRRGGYVPLTSNVSQVGSQIISRT